MASDITSGRQPATKADRAARPRQLALVVVTALVTLFAVLNLDEVQVNWIVGSWSTPLIVVIAVSAVLGALIDRVALRRRATRRSTTDR